MLYDTRNSVSRLGLLAGGLEHLTPSFSLHLPTSLTRRSLRSIGTSSPFKTIRFTEVQ